jgi:hypothetical protein
MKGNRDMFIRKGSLATTSVLSNAAESHYDLTSSYTAHNSVGQSLNRRLHKFRKAVHVRVSEPKGSDRKSEIVIT